MRLPSRFLHSLANVPVFVMAPETNVISANRLDGFPAKENRVTVREFHGAGLLSVSWFLKAHALAQAVSVLDFLAIARGSY